MLLHPYLVVDGGFGERGRSRVRRSCARGSSWSLFHRYVFFREQCVVRCCVVCSRCGILLRRPHRCWWR